MNKIILSLMVFAVTGFSYDASACAWVKVNPNFYECRTPFKKFFGPDNKRRKEVLNVALTRGKQKIYEIFNESSVTSLILEDESFYEDEDNNMEELDELLAKADQVIEVTNALSQRMDIYQKSIEYPDGFNWTKDLLPSGFVIGLTIPFKSGIPIPALKGLEILSKGDSKKFELGGGSAMAVLTIVPAIVEYVAEYRNIGEEFQGYFGSGLAAGGEIKADTGLVKIYDAKTGSKSHWKDRLRIWKNKQFQVHPSFDVAFKNEDAGKATKEGGLSAVQPTLGFIWGDTIMLPEHIGYWGVNYSLPTAISRFPLGEVKMKQSPLYQGTVLGKLFGTRYLTWAFLKALDSVGVETAKFSFNAGDWEDDNFDEEHIQSIPLKKESFPLNQFMLTLRAGDISNRFNKDKEALTEAALIRRARFGVNFGLNMFEIGKMLSWPESFFKSWGGGHDPRSGKPIRLTQKQLADQRLKIMAAGAFRKDLLSALDGAGDLDSIGGELSDEDKKELAQLIQETLVDAAKQEVEDKK